MDDAPAVTAELWPRAASLWERACRAAGVDQNDPRLAAAIGIPLDERDVLGVAGAPEGVEGIRWLAETYLSTVPRQSRSERGMFYTPSRLAALLAERALRHRIPEEGLVIDPACGAGSLLAAVVEVIVATQTAEEAVEFVTRRVRGTDLDPVATRLCDLSARVALLPAWAKLDDSARPTIPELVSVADGLADARPAALVIANPPFGRCRPSKAVRSQHARVLYGHAHWPSLFLHAAVERLGPGGVAAFVIPTSLVGGAYFQRLREYLIEHAPPTWLAFVEERNGVFSGDVLQEALLGLFVRGHDSCTVDVGRIGSTSLSEHAVARTCWHGGRPWLIARDPADLPLIATATDRTHRLADYGWKVSTGPLVWNRHKDQLFDDRGPGRLPVLWASDICDGGVAPTDLRPRRFLEPREGQDWLVLSRPAVLVQRTTAPEQPRRIVAGILDPATLRRLGGRVVVENHLNVCTWDGTTQLTPARLHAYLMGAEADRLYRCMTGSVAVSAFELGELPLPPPSELCGDEPDQQAA